MTVQRMRNAIVGLALVLGAIAAVPACSKANDAVTRLFCERAKTYVAGASSDQHKKDYDALLAAAPPTISQDAVAMKAGDPAARERITQFAKDNCDVDISKAA